MKPSYILRQLKKLPKKILGQNFLVDESVVNAIIEAAEINEEETVVEIGPGLGALTFPLLTHAKKVVAIEADREFAAYLKEHKTKNLTVIVGDALKIDWTITLSQISESKSQNDKERLKNKNYPKGENQKSKAVLSESPSYKLVGNIPYSITSPLLYHIFSLKNKPEKVVLLIQKEMAERITAVPGSTKRGFLTIFVEANAVARIVRRVKAGSFYPRPKVESAVIELIPHPKSQVKQIAWPAVEAGFRHKRQILINSLKDLNIPKISSVLLLEKCGLSSKIRPQELSFEDWKGLSERIKKFKSFYYLEEKA